MDYWNALWEYWFLVVIAGAVALYGFTTDLVEILKRVRVARTTWLAVVVGTFSCAQYLAWDGMREERDAALRVSSMPLETYVPIGTDLRHRLLTRLKALDLGEYVVSISCMNAGEARKSFCTQLGAIIREAGHGRVPGTVSFGQSIPNPGPRDPISFASPVRMRVAAEELPARVQRLAHELSAVVRTDIAIKRQSSLPANLIIIDVSEDPLYLGDGSVTFHR